MLSNLENFTMDVSGAHTFIGGDGYSSKFHGMMLVRFELGVYTLA